MMFLLLLSIKTHKPVLICACCQLFRIKRTGPAVNFCHNLLIWVRNCKLVLSAVRSQEHHVLFRYSNKTSATCFVLFRYSNKTSVTCFVLFRYSNKTSVTRFVLFRYSNKTSVTCFVLFRYSNKTSVTRFVLFRYTNKTSGHVTGSIMCC